MNDKACLGEIDDAMEVGVAEGEEKNCGVDDGL